MYTAKRNHVKAMGAADRESPAANRHPRIAATRLEP
jgi:hypothetical protein